MDDLTRLVVDGLRLLLSQKIDELSQSSLPPKERAVARVHADQIVNLIDELTSLSKRLLSPETLWREAGEPDNE